jgi:hypothetical protein
MKLSIGPAYATALLSEFGISGIPDLREVAERLNLKIKEVDAEGFDGALVRAEGLACGAIAVRQSIREMGRKNFTIAHEIGHYILPGHDASAAVCAPSDIGNWSDATQERERQADEFAAELLLPTSYAQPIFRGTSPSLNVIQEVAENSAASLSATAWRYCDLISERCAIVWSHQKRISWYKPSNEFGFFLKRGKVIEKGTQAYECFSGTRIHAKPEAIPADLWLDERVITKDSLIWEHSIGLPFYESVLSLLWIKERIEKYSDYDEPETEGLDPYRFDAARRKKL